ncbi:protein Niban 1-like [Sander vitreus]
MCQHIKGKSGGKLAYWDCPTAFPVFMQHPYSAPVCLATGSHREQTRWANILRAATQHQSSALWCEDSPESRAFLDAVSSLKKLRGNCQTEVYPVGDWEEVLVSMVMEDVMSYLKEKVFSRIIAHHSRRRTFWIRLLSEVYRTAKHQVKNAMVALKEELSLYRSDMEKQISAGLQQASLLQDHIAHTITVMRHSLPQQFVPLPVSPRNPCSSSSSFSEPVYHKLLPPGDCQQSICQTPEGSTLGSETLTPSTVSDRDDTLADSENSVNHTPSLLDAEE